MTHLGNLGKRNNLYEQNVNHNLQHFTCIWQVSPIKILNKIQSFCNPG